MSLRWRWALTLSLVAAVAIGVSITATLALAARQFRTQVDEELLTRVQLVVEQPRWALRSFTAPEGVPIGLDAVVIVLDRNGEVIASTINDPGIRLDDDRAFSSGAILTAEIEGRSYRVVTREIRIERGQRGYVQIAIDITDDLRAIRTLVRRLGFLGVLSTLMAGLLGWALAGRATKPITELSDAAATIARTERLDVPVNTYGPGEVGTLARSFQSMMASLSNSRRQQQSLVSNASHELRTPLTALRTNLETLSRSFDRLSEGQRTELIQAAVAEVNELADLSAELVDLATDVRHSDEPMVAVDLAELADSVVQRFSRRSGLIIEVLGSGATVDGRVSQLDRALSNLVSNAVKWSASGDRIQVCLDGRRVTVLDSGPGIPHEDIPQVFERFYRSRAARTEPGSGLGLAIVEHIVTAHGGSVFAANRPEGGAAVGFQL